MTNPTPAAPEGASAIVAVTPRVTYTKISAQALIDEGFPINTPLKLPAQRGVHRAEKLAKKTGYYIVPEAGEFFYFRISAPTPKGDYLYEFTPPVGIVKEGFVVVDKVLLYVTLNDLERGVIRKSREVITKKLNVTYNDFVNNTYGPAPRAKTPAQESAATDHRVPSQAGGAETLSDFLLPISDSGSDNQRGSGKEVVVDEHEAIMLAFKEQERALYDSILEEEGWSGQGEVEEVAQPR